MEEANNPYESRKDTDPSNKLGTRNSVTPHSTKNYDATEHPIPLNDSFDDRRRSIAKGSKVGGRKYRKRTNKKRKGGKYKKTIKK
jgi:hypothetical protein